MPGEIERMSNVLLEMAKDKTFGGMRKLFRGLSEERARWFIEWLASETEDKQVRAEVVLGTLLKSKNGTRILRHVCRDVLFGTDTISVAALALITSQASLVQGDAFYTRAAAALDGIANEDVLVFLCFLNHLEDASVSRQKWRTFCHFDLKVLDRTHWMELKHIFGIGHEQVYCALSECVNRRLFLPDTGPGRLGGHDDYVPIHLFFSDDTARYFTLLARATEVAEPDCYRHLAPLNSNIVEAACRTAEPPVEAAADRSAI